jgi:antitoxin component of MazEF toxin-antitoxin module
MALAIRTISLDGTALLENGQEVQLVVARNGVLGARPVTREDHLSGIDQISDGPSSADFDTSGLDQPV